MMGWCREQAALRQSCPREMHMFTATHPLAAQQPHSLLGCSLQGEQQGAQLWLPAPQGQVWGSPSERCPPQGCSPHRMQEECYNYPLSSKAAASCTPGLGTLGWHCLFGFQASAVQGPAWSRRGPGALLEQGMLWEGSMALISCSPKKGQQVLSAELLLAVLHRGTVLAKPQGCPPALLCLQQLEGEAVGPSARRPHRGCCGPWPYTSCLAQTRAETAGLQESSRQPFAPYL